MGGLSLARMAWRWRWGEAYDLAVTRAGWVAKRLDNGRALVASGPDELRELIVADDQAEPVARDVLGQAS